MSKHTPGPWTSENSGLCQCVYATGPYGDALRIAEMIGPKEEENGQLMAAAPELLAALELIDSNAAESVEWIRRVARDAISKATA